MNTHADLIFTMTRSHREMLLNQWPEAAPRTFLTSSYSGNLGFAMVVAGVGLARHRPPTLHSPL